MKTIEFFLEKDLALGFKLYGLTPDFSCVIKFIKCISSKKYKNKNKS